MLVGSRCIGLPVSAPKVSCGENTSALARSKSKPLDAAGDRPNDLPFVNDWAVKVGIAHVFWVLCSVAAGLLLTYPVVFFFGKQYRVYWSKHNLMDKFYAALSKR